jgi:hypothetical protein
MRSDRPCPIAPPAMTWTIGLREDCSIVSHARCALLIATSASNSRRRRPSPPSSLPRLDHLSDPANSALQSVKSRHVSLMLVNHCKSRARQDAVATRAVHAAQVSTSSPATSRTKKFWRFWSAVAPFNRSECGWFRLAYGTTVNIEQCGARTSRRWRPDPGAA